MVPKNRNHLDQLPNAGVDTRLPDVFRTELSRNSESHVVLLDGGSGDESPGILRQALAARNWEKWVTLIELAENRGFSAANNAGIAAATDCGRFDTFLLVNSDTHLRPGAVDAMCERLRRDRTIGLVGPRLEWPDSQFQPSCFRNISPFTELIASAKTGPLSRLFPRGELVIKQPDDGDIDWISFACVLVRREVLESVGPLDEGFFMYFEDVDYCRRARRAGWRIAYEPEARVVHLRGGRTPEEFSREERRRRPEYYYRSRSRYMAKFYGRVGPCLANVAWQLGRGVSLFREILGKKEPHTAAGEARDIWKGSLCGFGENIRSVQPTRLTASRIDAV